MNKRPMYKKILDILKSGKEYKISFIGDSLTSAEWVHPNWRDSFEYILKFSFEEFQDEDWWVPEWNLKFFNYSLDGASTREFVKQIKICKEQVNPDLYIIMGTSNDIELNISVNEHIKNFDLIYKLINDRDIIFAPDIYSNDVNLNNSYKKYVDGLLNSKIIEDIILVNGFEIFKSYPIQNFFTLDLDKDYDRVSKQLKDLVHPNALGNVYIAKMFLEEVFGIGVNSEKYLQDIRSDTVKYPRWS
jgi:lysophospholipase L1-like esterase